MQAGLQSRYAYPLGLGGLLVGEALDVAQNHGSAEVRRQQVKPLLQLLP